MTRRQPIFAVITLLMLPSWSWAASDQESQSGSQASNEGVFADIQARTNGEPVFMAQPVRYSQYDVRFGGWRMWSSGSPQKVGEYQDLKSSPFWDVDGFSSNGTRTLGITVTGTDNETSLGRVYYYQPDVTARLQYDRFLHRRDHDPLNNMLGPFDVLPDSGGQSAQTSPQTPTAPGPMVIKEDLNVGQDYAVRVQEVKSSFKAMLSDNLRVRLDVWGMQKEGTRQANAVAMCYANNTGAGVPPTTNPLDLQLPPDHPPLTQFAGNRCHVLSQAQHIDWTTTEVKPAIEVHLGDRLVIEYSRPMRTFTANDQTVTRFYDRTGDLSYSPTNFPDPRAYAVVPESYTQMDQLKISGEITEDTKAYAFLMIGDTVNREIHMTRFFNNADVRVTNTSLQNLTLTGYAGVFNEDEQMPIFVNVNALNSPYSSTTYTGPEIDHPLNYRRSTAGVRSTWRPRGGGFDLGGLAIVSGYEYRNLERKFAEHEFETGGELDNTRTITNTFQIGPDMRWSPCLDTYLRYKFQHADQPLLGLQDPNGLTNTLLPQRDHIVEMGLTWVPSDWFLFNANVGIETADTRGTFGDSTKPVNFNEQSYPMTFSAWYAASNRLSLSAGYAVYSNFVAQNINLADQSSFPTEGGSVAPVSSRWNYGARAQVVTFGSRYLATERVTLTGEVEWVRGHDLITNSAITFPSGITVTDLGSFSEVLNESTRLRVGADWLLRPRVVAYCRYELYRFKDMAPAFQGGLAQGVLGGLSALF